MGPSRISTRRKHEKQNRSEECRRTEGDWSDHDFRELPTINDEQLIHGADDHAHVPSFQQPDNSKWGC